MKMTVMTSVMKTAQKIGSLPDTGSISRSGDIVMNKLMGEKKTLETKQ